MACEYVKVGGLTAICCGRGPALFCCFCHERAATKLCDYPVPENKSATCDAPICNHCTTRVGPNRDYCPAHKQHARQGGLFE